MDIISRIALGQKETKQFCNENLPNVHRIFTRSGKTKFQYYAEIFPILKSFIRDFLRATFKLRNDPFGNIIQLVNHEVIERKKIRVFFFHNLNENIIFRK